ncbi:MAG: CAF17-like 4Fe-4S cluster assembly/insertion protein YgfZ [Rhodanobacter sp.]
MGWPWLPEPTLNLCLPPALSLYRLHAVAIDKGCYPGQEMVARLHYRGGHKRHLHHVVLSQPVAPGSSLCVSAREVGLLLDVVQNDTITEALVVLSDEMAEQAVSGVLPTFDRDLSVRIESTWAA